MKRSAIPEHYKVLYEYVLACVGETPIDVGTLAQMVHMDLPEQFPTRMEAQSALSYMITAKHRTNGERFTRFHRPRIGAYCVTSTLNMNDVWRGGNTPLALGGEGMRRTTSTPTPPTPTPPAPPAHTTRIFREIGVLSSGTVLVKDSDDKIYELRPL